MEPKNTVSNILEDTEPEKSFWMSDGRTLKNLKDLKEALETMSQEVWNSHVNSEKNDFANWVEGVFGEKQLGLSLRKVKSPRTAAKRVASILEVSKYW
jgi:hypothetical protein